VRITIIAVGRMKSGPERELVTRYLERARNSGKLLGLTGFDVTELTESRASSAPARKAEEAKIIRAAVPEGARLITLDENGKAFSSEKFAAEIALWRDNGAPAIAFVIGGPDGLDPSLVDEAATCLTLSKMTWPHQLARMLLAEQLYRTNTILSGHPYHRS